MASGTTNGYYQAYVRDWAHGTTTLLSSDPGLLPWPNDVLEVSLSADGQKALFLGADSTSNSDDNNSTPDIFFRDLSTNKIQLVSAREPSLVVVTANSLSGLSPNAVSADGRFVVFTSLADDLVANDTNATQDIFVRDLVSGTTLLASMNTDNTGSAGGSSYSPSISADGRFVVFLSVATNLVMNDTNNAEDAFVRDLTTGVTRLIQTPQFSSVNYFLYPPTISGDGRYVVFYKHSQIFLWDSQVDQVQLIDQNTNYTARLAPVISADGHYAAFLEGAPPSLFVRDINLATNLLVARGGASGTASNPIFSPDSHYLAYELQTLSNHVILVYDPQTQETIIGSPSWDGSGGAVGSTFQKGSTGASMSSGGRLIAFQSVATNVIPGDTNEVSDVLVRDLQRETNILVSVNRGGTGPGNGASDQAMLSGDGRYVVFRSVATDLVAEETAGEPNLYVRDLVSGTTALLSAKLAGTAAGNNRSSLGLISANSRVVVFESVASDLVAGDFNNASDIFYVNLPSTNTAGYRLGLAPSVPSTVPTLTWDIVPGLSYQVQYKNSLSETVWLPLPGTPTTNGSTASLSDSNTTRLPQRFYRLQIGP